MTTFVLKIIAAIFMTIDHVGDFIPNMPIWLHWIGRLAAPIFVFCTTMGFKYTRDKRLLAVRLYIAGLLMSILQFQFGMQNNFFRVLFTLVVVLYIIELFNCDRKKFKKYAAIYVIWQLTAVFLITISISGNGRLEDFSVYVLAALFGSVFNLEGGLVFVVLGVLIYLMRKDKVKLGLSYSVFCGLYFIITTTPIVLIVVSKIGRVSQLLGDILEYSLDAIVGFPPMSLNGSPLYQNYQWMMIFSLPFFLFYNQKRGKKIKWLFYIYYPIHIICLYKLGIIIQS